MLKRTPIRFPEYVKRRLQLLALERHTSINQLVNECVLTCIRREDAHRERGGLRWFPEGVGTEMELEAFFFYNRELLVSRRVNFPRLKQRVKLPATLDEIAQQLGL